MDPTEIGTDPVPARVALPPGLCPIRRRSAPRLVQFRPLLGNPGRPEAPEHVSHDTSALRPSRMPSSRQNRDPATPLRDAILQEARNLLEGGGYAALSTRRIASAVGCTATSIYLHFKSKDSLIYALIDEGFEELNRRVLDVSRGEGDALHLLRDVAGAYVAFGLERPEYYEIMFMLRAEQMERYPVDAYRRARRSLDVFAELTALPPKEAARRGALVWSALHGLVSLLIAQRIDISLEREALIEDSIHAASLGAFAALPSGTPPA